MSCHNASFNGHRRVPLPSTNRSVATRPASPERASLKARLQSDGGRDDRHPARSSAARRSAPATPAASVMPHDHSHVLGRLSQGQPSSTSCRRSTRRARRAREWAQLGVRRSRGGPAQGRRAADDHVARHDQRRDDARPVEDGVPGRDRRGVRAHRLLALQRALRPASCSTSSRSATTRCGTSSSTAALEGFVYAVTPFNFTSIGGNLPTAPALMGNTVVWKPASSAMFSALLPDEAARGGRPAARRHQLRRRRRGDDLEGAARRTATSPASTSPAAPRSSTTCGRRSAPRWPPTAPIRASSAKPAARTSSSRTRRRTRTALAVAIVRGGFEYQGQKCSAASRVYVPRSMWNDVRDRVVAMIDEIKMGDVADFRNFMGAVIDKRAFDKISGYIDARARQREDRRRRQVRRRARATSSARRWSRPTTRATACCARRSSGRSSPPTSTTMRKWAETLQLVDATSPYALTGAVFAQDRARDRRSRRRRCATRPATSTSTTSRPAPSSASSRSAARARSGTNDKAGSKLNLMRWVSARTVKENFNPPRDYRYPFMAEA